MKCKLCNQIETDSTSGICWKCLSKNFISLIVKTMEEQKIDNLISKKFKDKGNFLIKNYIIQFYLLILIFEKIKTSIFLIQEKKYNEVEKVLNLINKEIEYLIGENEF